MSEPSGRRVGSAWMIRRKSKGFGKPAIYKNGVNSNLAIGAWSAWGMPVQKPKVGDSILFWPQGTSAANGDQPVNARITTVFNDHSVNIDLFDAQDIKIGQKRGVYLYQRDGKDRPLKEHCDWVK